MSIATIILKPCKSFLKHVARGESKGMMPWKRSPPFAVNPRGLLTHRVKHVTTYIQNDEPHHRAVTYLCGNGCCFGLRDDVLVSEPPSDRFLCDFCEAVAARQKLPSGDELAGRHIHRGVLIPKQVCCTPKEQSHAD